MHIHLHLLEILIHRLKSRILTEKRLPAGEAARAGRQGLLSTHRASTMHSCLLYERRRHAASPRLPACPSIQSAVHSSQLAKQAEANGQYTRRSHVMTEQSASRAVCVVLRVDVEDEVLEPGVLTRPMSQVNLETVCDLM